MKSTLEKTWFALKNKPETSLQNKTALVTGATSGIGLATALKLASENTNLRLIGRRHDRLEMIKNFLLQMKPDLKIEVFKFDLTSETDWKKFGPDHDLWKVDILVNNAGLALGRDPIVDTPLESFQKMFQTNVESCFRVLKSVLPYMINKQSGHIVHLGSIAGRETYESGGAYCATKYAIHSLHRALRLETAGNNIRALLLAPGMVETAFSEVRFHGDLETAKNVYKGMRALTAEDMATLIVDALKAPSHVNVDEVLVFPTQQASSTKFYRES